MTILAILTDLRLFISMVIEMTWRGFAMLLDALITISPFQAAMAILTLLSLIVAGALGMQRHTNKILDENPDTEIFPLGLEYRYSLIGGLIRMIANIVLLPLRLLQGLLSIFTKDDDKKEDEEEEEKKPVLIPALGPSYVWAALITLGLYLLAVIVEPLIRWQLGAPTHFPTWQYLFFGHRPELAPFMPLQTYPYAAAIVIVTFWLGLWWTIARGVRLFHWNEIGVNLIKNADDQATLPSWRTHFGVTNLADLDISFHNWARWLPLVALPLLGIAFLGISGDPYRVNTSSFSVALVAWLSWALHLNLSGLYRPEEPPAKEEEQPQQATAAGWTQVLNDLRRVHKIGQPKLAQPMRDVEPLAFSQQSLTGSRLIAPLLAELLPEPSRLTAMQQDVLENLSKHSFVHLDPPGDTRTLDLGARNRDSEEELRHRNQIVIAPEGTGKTTLGMLAAFNTSLIHSRSTLVVVRNKATGDRLARDLQNQVEPSTLRWNLRIRQLGGDLAEDLATGIIPDLLICDLQQLVTSLLDDVETYQPFLTNLGLIIVDDIETFCGPVEVHAQLAFRRLDLRLRTLRGVDQIGEEQAPIFLLLAGESMENLPAWARSLCGIDAVPRYFASQRATHLREQAQQARRQVEEGGRKISKDDREVEMTADGRRRRHLIYNLDDFATHGGEVLSVLDIIEACEELAVPWHYRPCGDNRRLLGRSILPLRNEPQSHVDDPLRASVVFLDGHATAVARELERIRRAGAKFSSRAVPEELRVKDEDKAEAEKNKEDETDQQSEPEEKPEEIEAIALITIIDPEEQRIFNTVDATEGISDLVRTLPRPFLRAPSGYLTRRHLTSELIQHWTEVADLLDVFGNDIAPLLRDLTRQNAILHDPRTTLEPGKKSYEKRVFLRGLEAELLGRNPGAKAPSGLLPPPVEDVEVASRRHVSLRERTTLADLGRVDAESARHRFYPGRIFETDRGRHVVVAYANQDASEGAFEVGDIIAEPFLGDEITSPRRRTTIDLIARQSDALAAEPLFLGDAPLGVGLFPVQCRMRHQATFRLAPHTGEIRQRIYRSQRDQHQESTLHTQALAIFPVLEIEDAPQGCPLPLGAARLIAAALRAVTPLIYRGADAALGLALHIGDEDIADGDLLKPTDGFFFYDLHGGGNGAARAIERDGIEIILRLADHLLRHTGDARRLLALHDEWDGVLDEEARHLACETARAWFKSRLEHTPDEDEES